jgi:hypothetical protein
MIYCCPHNFAGQRFRKGDIFMSKSKRSLEEQIKAANERYNKMFEKAKQYEERKKQLERKKKEEDRKARTHRLIQIGGAAESVLGREFEEEDIILFTNFLKQQERNGGYFTKAMSKSEAHKVDETAVGSSNSFR